MITITVNTETKYIPEGMSLRQVMLAYTPYGDEATIVIHNGGYIKSIDLNSDEITVKDGDVINIVPLIIGG